MRNSEFPDHFEAKGRFSSDLADIPVWVVTRHYPGLFGAANKFTIAGY
ncbi:MAG: hypothetical protein HOH14_09690 [Gammaproteobacteria bacterium]|nr:hypothetical protein [Gammaproteobacteria bacterium]MBT6043752.1 hypothetical protein [Gammaproteobacteria bacterium]